MSSSTSDWEPPLPEDLQRLLPQYEITGVLGRGGMGAVYKARQPNLDRVVAIKLLPETFSKGGDDLNFAARFKQEARAMARLDHPAIISVYDFGETAEGQLYFVMEFIDGMDIQQYLRAHGGKLPQESAISIVAHVLDALDYAHSQGIVHRDIKPANIMLNRAGRVKVADFGLAKKFGEHADADAPALTMSNVAVGTPDFVAPEALDPDATPDHRADLYAVGVMLYQLLTGKLPRGIMVQMPSEMRPELDPRLDDVVIKGMEANPDYRYPSAAAMRADLNTILSQPMAAVEAGTDTEEVPAAVPLTRTVKGSSGGSSAQPPKPRTAPLPPPKSNTGLIVGLIAAAAVVIGLGVFWVFGPKRGTGNPPEVVEKTGKGRTTEGTEITEGEKKTPAPVPPSPVPVAKMDDPPAAPDGKSGTMPAPAPSPTPSVPNPAEGKAPAPTPPLVAKVDPPATMPPDPVLPPPSPHAKIASLPGLKTRLDGYHAARAKQLGELAGKYLGGLESRLNQAADAGDLKLATAFGEEKARIETLMKTLAAPPADPLAAAADRTAPLAALAEGSPEVLATLRQTWTTESDKIRVALDAALRQSLQALEAELTKARDFEKAKGVLAYRESLADPAAAAAPAAVASIPPPATKAPSAGADPILSRATKDAPFTNTLGMKFVPVPGTDILLCIHETRKGDYAKFAAENPGEVHKSDWKNPTEVGVPVSTADDHPVVNVSWNNAKSFCAWLSQKEGRTYRLPTDREWSVAVGIAKEEKEGLTPEELHEKIKQYPWGKDFPIPRGAGNYGDTTLKDKLPDRTVVNDYTDGFATTAPVMSFKADRLGLFDLGGNVREWCEDWYNAEQKGKLLRGADWSTRYGPAFYLSKRGIGRSDIGVNYDGFRCALVISPVNAAPGTTPAATLPAAPTSPPPSAVKPAAPDPILARATKDAPFTNTLGMKFVPVPETDVLFCIHETRYKDYQAYAKESPGTDKRWENQKHESFEITDRPEDHPVVWVRWEDAQAYCAWLSKKEGLTYRLPTDREWSLAVGIGREENWTKDTTPATVFKPKDAFPWGDLWPPPKGAGNYSDEGRPAKAPGKNAPYLEGYDDGFPTTAPVMSFEANKLGLFDLGGNVSEWCEYWYDNVKKDPVLRSSSWGHSVRDDLVSSRRQHFTPTTQNNMVGFRCVVVVSPGAPAR